ncbi:MAG: hypothetical protein ACUVWO_11015 [Thermodesulfobacteriota bacterium]
MKSYTAGKKHEPLAGKLHDSTGSNFVAKNAIAFLAVALLKETIAGAAWRDNLFFEFAAGKGLVSI